MWCYAVLGVTDVPGLCVVLSCRWCYRRARPAVWCYPVVGVTDVPGLCVVLSCRWLTDVPGLCVVLSCRWCYRRARPVCDVILSSVLQTCPACSVVLSYHWCYRRARPVCGVILSLVLQTCPACVWCYPVVGVTDVPGLCVVLSYHRCYRRARPAVWCYPIIGVTDVPGLCVVSSYRWCYRRARPVCGIILSLVLQTCPACLWCYPVVGVTDVPGLQCGVILSLVLQTCPACLWCYPIVGVTDVPGLQCGVILSLVLLTCPACSVVLSCRWCYRRARPAGLRRGAAAAGGGDRGAAHPHEHALPAAPAQVRRDAAAHRRTVAHLRARQGAAEPAAGGWRGVPLQSAERITARRPRRVLVRAARGRRDRSRLAPREGGVVATDRIERLEVPPFDEAMEKGTVGRGVVVDVPRSWLHGDAKCGRRRRQRFVEDRVVRVVCGVVRRYILDVAAGGAMRGARG